MRRLLVALMLSLASPTFVAHAAALNYPAANDRDLQAFVEQFTADVAQDPIRMATTVDIDLLVEAVFQDLDVEGYPPDRLVRFKAAFANGMRQGLANTQAQMGPMLRGARVRVMGLRWVDTSPRIVVRTLLADGSMTYRELLLAKHDGEIKIFDAIDHGLGTTLSETMQQMLPMVMPAKPGETGGPDEQAMADLRVLRAHVAEFRNGQYREAYAGLIKTPEPFGSMQFVSAYRTMCAMHLDDDEVYAKELLRHLSMYEHSPSMELHAIDHHYLQGNYPEVLTSLQRLENYFGPDAWLAAMQGFVLVEMEQYVEGIEHVERANTLEPGLAEAAAFMIGVYGVQGDVEAGIDVFERALQHGAHPDTLLDEPVPEITDTPEYKKWRKKAKRRVKKLER